MFKYFTTRFPKTSKMVFSGSVFALSDYIAQSFKKKEIDYFSLLRFSTYGFFFQAPFLHFYLPYLDKLFPNSLINHRRVVFKKLFFDQLITAPLTMIFFIIYNNYDIFKRSFEKPISYLIKEEWWNLCLANWSIWPFVNYFTFSVIPLNYRLYFINTIGLFWTIFICWSIEHVKK